MNIDAYFKSSYNGSWWMRYSYDRPNKFYGAFDNLPLKVQAKLKAQKKV